MQKLLLLLLVPTLGLAEPLRVFASVVPIQTLVQKTGGEHVDARAMVRPGFNPYTYDPTPKQISALAGAVLYVRTGVPFEKAWMERIRSANPAMQEEIKVVLVQPQFDKRSAAQLAATRGAWQVETRE